MTDYVFHAPTVRLLADGQPLTAESPAPPQQDPPTETPPDPSPPATE